MNNENHTEAAPLQRLVGRFRNAVLMEIGEWERHLIDEYAQTCACGGDYAFYDLDAANYKAGICHRCGRETCLDTNLLVVCHDTARANRFTPPAPNSVITGLPPIASPDGQPQGTEKQK